MHNQAFLNFIDAQAARWNFGAKQDDYILSVLDDQNKAGKLLSRNWVCLWPDFVGYPSAIHQKIAKMDFSENRLSVEKGGWFQ